MIVEGYFACFNVWKTGHHRVVALMGSSMSAQQYEHIKQLVNSNDHILLILDEDEAGRGGRSKIIPELAKIAFTKAITFDQENTSPDDLSSDDLAQLLA